MYRGSRVLTSEDDVQRMEEERRTAQALKFKHDEATALGQQPQPAPQGMQQPGMPAPEPAAQAAPEPFVREGRKIGRNEPCPCGSGKKFKQCHGKLS